jgi:hypothetical protein
VRAIAAAVEMLESRLFLSAVTGQAHTTFAIANAGGSLSPPFSPAQIRQAYNLDNLQFGNIAASGAGQTIAIIDAFNDPNIVSDLGVFDSTYNLQQFNVEGGPTFKVVNQNGSTTGLPVNADSLDWAIEESLDVEWAHTIAPLANITLYEANSSELNDLFSAIDAARHNPSVSVVSMSFGSGEFASETQGDPFFTTPAGHNGVTFVASTGDTGATTEYPSVSPDVLAVGGTSLTINADGSYGSESAWSSGGGGVSLESQPTFQSSFGDPFSTTKRTVPDVAWLADPNTGVDVYDSYDEVAHGNDPFFQIGGTSLAAPMWSALISIVDQGRAIAGQTSLDGATQTLPDIYSLPASAFNDITVGSNGHPAQVGYDLATGRGTPNLPNLVNDLISVSPTAFYVDTAASGAVHDGSSWNNAFTDLQSALAAAQTVENTTPNTPISIYVAQGTYIPSSSDPTAAFQLISDVSIYGGYVGAANAANPGVRDVNLFKTTLSGDNLDYHVVTGSGVDSTALLDGFTISGGNANGSGGATSSIGGGMFNGAGNPTLNDIIFTGNSSSGSGGAMANIASSPILTSCTFSGNTSTNGGAISDLNGSAPNLTDCTFTGDTATDAGGVIYDNTSSPVLTNCTLTGNSSDLGGAMYEFNSSSAVVTQCLFTTNAGIGGAVAVNLASPDFINCDFTANSSAVGGAFYLFNNATPTITNCILWANPAYNGGEIANDGSGAPTVTYSDVQGGFADSTDINADPLFVSAAAGNYALSENSPCIDAANNAALSPAITTDLAGLPRRIDGLADMGAFEYQTTYVSAAATGLNNGSSWTNAFTTVQQALAVAQYGQTIEIGQGTYFTTGGAAGTFNLVAGVNMLGGFAGSGAANPDVHNPASFTTTLSGNNTSYHVLTANNLDNATTIDGFVITGGKANGSNAAQKQGGGLTLNSGSLNINNCTFSGDTATAMGGALYAYAADPVVSNCTFSGDTTSSTNTATWFYYCVPTINNSTFTQNSGVAIYNDQSVVTLTSCIITHNGMGMENVSAQATLTNCLFANNSNHTNGGAMFNNHSSPTLSNCTFTQNTAALGGAMYNTNSSSPKITNSIFYADAATSGGNEFSNHSSSTPAVTSSDIQGGLSGSGNINANPLFVGSANFQLTINSPCINAGSNQGITAGVTTDLLGNARIIGGTVDMGAYEFSSPPAFLSSTSTIFSIGVANTFTIKVGGQPASAITFTGSLPTGVSFHDNGNGTATLSGTPAAGTLGNFPLVFHATNGLPPDASQNFTLTVDQAPAITSSSTATFLVGSAGSFTITTTGVPIAALSESGALPTGLSFHDNGDGTATLSGTPAAGTGKNYSLTLTAANAALPNATQTLTLTVDQSPQITSGNSTTFTTGKTGTFTTTSTGFPIPSMSETGAMPAGTTFFTNGLGAGTITGTPGPNTGGIWIFTLNSLNNIQPTAHQTFTLTVDQAPAITSSTSTTFTVGSAGSFTFTTTGFPIAAINKSGALPTGVSLIDNGDGTATLAGTPTSGTAGNYSLVITAANGTLPNATQNFTLTVNQSPAITSAQQQTFFVGQSSNFTITTTGFPTSAIGETGALPTGMSFLDNGDGTATLSGTPAIGAFGIYNLIITASNGVSPNASQNFTLTVNQAASITSNATATFTVGTSNSITVSTTGYPTAALSETGALPNGLTFIDNGNGTATLSGTPVSGTSGLYSLNLIANNGIAPIASQTFTISVTSSAPFIWTGAGDGSNWNDPNNWSAQTVPGATNDAFIPPGFGTVQIPAGSFTVHSLMSASSLQIDGNAILAILAPSAISSTLTIQSTGAIDLTTASLAFDYGASNASPFAAIQTYLTNNAIFSSAVQANPQAAIAYADGSVDSGTAAQSGQLLLKYTLNGDTNLDGLVNFQDLVAVVQNFNKPNSDWASGNFNFGPSTNFNDLVAVVQNFNKILNPPAANGATQLGGSTIPLAQSATFRTSKSSSTPVSPTQNAQLAELAPTVSSTDPLSELLQISATPASILSE